MHKRLKTDSHFVHFEVHMCFENFCGSINYSLKSLKRALVVGISILFLSMNNNIDVY